MRNHWITIKYHYGSDFKALVKFPNGKEEIVRVKEDPTNKDGILFNIHYNVNDIIALIPLDEVCIIKINPDSENKITPFNYNNRFRK